MLLKNLNQFAVGMNSKYPYMNSGGCGIFAVHIAKRLQDIVPVRIVVCNYDKLDLNNIRSRIRNPYSLREWNNQDVIFMHLVVEFEYNGIEYHYDTNGVRLKEDKWDGAYPFSTGSFTIEEVSAFVAKQYGWNNCFDRDDIPSIKRNIKNLFRRFIGNGCVYYTPIENKRLEQYNNNPIKEMTTRLFLPS